MKIFIASGELSGDLLAAEIAMSLRATHPDIEWLGTVGPELRKMGVREVFAMESLQVMGFSDIVSALPRLMRKIWQMQRVILQEQPDIVLTVDYADFHLMLHRILRIRGYQGRLMHAVCPSIWAWRKGRIRPLVAHLDHLFTLLPFEKALFDPSALSVTYLGHPLQRKIQSYIASPLFPEKKLLAIFPGSRKAVIGKNLPIQFEAAMSLQQKIPELEIAISVACAEDLPLIQKLAPPALYVPHERRYDLMKEACLSLATSGTVTLELALFQVPTVVTYAIRKLDQWLASRLFKVDLPYYALPNILAQMEVFPELFGDRLRADALYTQAHALWKTRHRCREECLKVGEVLGNIDFSAAVHQAMNFS